MEKSVKGKEYFRHYQNVHSWVKSKLGKANRCSNPNCKSVAPKRYEWALIEGMQYEKKVENFMPLCPSCHRIYDKASIGRIVSESEREDIRQRNSKPILQIDPNTLEVVKEWSSTASAVRELKINSIGITHVLVNRRKRSGGFIWRHKAALQYKTIYNTRQLKVDDYE